VKAPAATFCAIVIVVFGKVREDKLSQVAAVAGCKPKTSTIATVKRADLTMLTG
jgi:hypothetical protein